MGALSVFVGLASCALVFYDSHLAWVVVASGLIGFGFGLSYAFITQGILGALTDSERAIGGAGIATVRLTGAAAGSAMAAAVANLAGFAHGFSTPQREHPGFGCSSPHCRSQRSPVLALGRWVDRASSVPWTLRKWFGERVSALRVGISGYDHDVGKGSRARCFERIHFGRSDDHAGVRLRACGKLASSSCMPRNGFFRCSPLSRPSPPRPLLAPSNTAGAPNCLRFNRAPTEI